jgi:hypothetical protein
MQVNCEEKPVNVCFDEGGENVCRDVTHTVCKVTTGETIDSFPETEVTKIKLKL